MGGSTCIGDIRSSSLSLLLLQPTLDLPLAVLASEGWPRLLYAVWLLYGKVAVCCIIQQPKPDVRAAVWPPYSSIQQLFCCIAVWFAVWNDLMYGVYGVHVDPIQVG